MEDNVYFTSLFDIYGILLTEKQQEYFKLYYFEDLLLDEISENFNISKNAVSKEIKRAKKMLDYYEEKLHLYTISKTLYKEFEDEPDTLQRIERITSGNTIEYDWNLLKTID